MVWGVPMDYFAISFGVGSLTGLAILYICRHIFGFDPAGFFLVMGTIAAYLGYGKIRAKHDPEFLTVYFRRMKYMAKTKGVSDGNVYYP